MHIPEQLKRTLRTKSKLDSTSADTSRFICERVERTKSKYNAFFRAAAVGCLGDSFNALCDVSTFLVRRGKLVKMTKNTLKVWSWTTFPIIKTSSVCCWVLICLAEHPCGNGYKLFFGQSTGTSCNYDLAKKSERKLRAEWLYNDFQIANPYGFVHLCLSHNNCVPLFFDLLSHFM